ncbi:MAG: hypothetical protein LQ343_006689 [Gyalolechia ehrenbergii]|nr:MAG: hypothetical protein LQ343_006689 [Gyalolechia ehrenbergii]
MWQVRRNASKSPIALYAFQGQSFFAVQETAYTKKARDVETKIHRWTQGSRHQVRLICALQIQIEKPGTSHRELASIIRPRKQGGPDNYTIVDNWVIDHEEIYPQLSGAKFNITRADVLPPDAEEDGTVPANYAAFSLLKWYSIAKSAVEWLEKYKHPKGSSCYDPKQMPIVSPESSEREGLENSESNGEDPTDGDYIP